MEDLLMGDIPSDDSDAEDNNSKGLATQVTASTTSTATNKKNNQPVVSGSTTTSSSSTTQAGSNSKSELTNRLKSLYKSPPGAAAQQTSATSKVNVPSQQQAVTAVKKQQQNLPVSTPIQSNMRRGSSIPTTSVNTAVVSRGPSQNNTNPPQKHVPPMIHQNHQGPQPNPGVVQQQQQQQQSVRPGGVQPPVVVGRVPAPLPKAR